MYKSTKAVLIVWQKYREIIPGMQPNISCSTFIECYIVGVLLVLGFVAGDTLEPEVNLCLGVLGFVYWAPPN